MRLLDAHVPAQVDRDAAVALGVFDGMHRGHQSVVEGLVRYARTHDLESVVVTFDPTPAEVLQPDRAPKLLQSFQDRLNVLADFGVDEVRVVRFNETWAHEPAEEFVQRVLVGNLRARHVVIGEDFQFGRDRIGNAELLRQMGTANNYSVQVADLVSDGEKISSTRIREAVLRGEVENAGLLLGRPFSFTEQLVEHGDARGAELGFPTANVHPSPRLIRPGIGIYAGVVRLDNGMEFAAAISVGRRPQFYKDGDVLIEAHLLDFTGDLYGTSIDVAFLRWLRGETKYEGVEALQEQIARDVAETERVYSEFLAG